MPSKKREFGDIGEREAEDFLSKKGYKIVSRNYRVKNIGEIDLTTKMGNKITFFEVKTRGVGHETNFPIQFSINEKKRRNLKRICQIYLAENKIKNDWQVDAIFIKIDPNTKQYTIDHLENILWESYY